MSQYYDLNNTGPQVQDRLDQTQENKQDIATLEEKVTAIENEIGESGQGGNTINARLDALETAVGSGGSVDERIAAAETEIIGGASSDYNTLGKVEGELEDTYRKNETYSKTELDNLITTPNVLYVTVIATSGTTDVTTLLPATGAADTVYRVGNWDGTQYDPTMYALFAWNGTTYVCLAVRSFVGEVYDVSVNHPDGQGNPTPYADLTTALGTSGANIPADIRRGGMSIKFIQGNVQSSDNKYVQYFLTKDEWSTNEADWQKLNLEEEISQLEAKVTEKFNTKRDVSLGSNIVDLGAVSRNSAINISGEIVTGLSDNYMISAYIPVDGKDIISNGWKDTSGAWSTYAVYNENLVLLRTIGNNRQYTYQSGDYYVRITFQAHPNDAQANYGTTLLEFEPYTQNYDFESGLASLNSKISLLYENSYSYEELGDGYYRTPSLFYNDDTYRYIKLSAKDVTSFYTELLFPAPVPAILIIGPNNNILHSYNTDDADHLYKKEITAEELVGAEYIVVQTYNYSIATYDFVLDVRFSTIRISNPKNILKVGKDNKYFNYNEIQPALESITDDSADNPYVIKVYPGDYKPFQIQSNRARYISIIGIEKYSTRVICTSGKYDDTTTILHLYGIISGLTFISNFDDFASESDYVTWINTAGNNGAYALHIDGTTNAISQNLIVENCIIRSFCNSSLGIGLHQNEILIIKNCDIYYDASDAVAQRFVRGAIYCHSYPVSSEEGISVTNQNFRLDGNRINGKNNGTAHPSYLSYIEYMSNNQGQCNFEFFDNIFVPNGVARTRQIALVMTYGTNPFSAYINEASHGNNVASLNKPEFSQ